jgi:hypothetical protein
MVGACSAYGGEERRGVYRVLVGETCGKETTRETQVKMEG